MPALPRGLTTAQAHERLAQYGPNRLVPAEARSGFLTWVLRPLADPMAILLLVAGGTYLALGDALDAIVTLAALVPITAVTLVLERRAERALESLKRLAAPTAQAWRDERLSVIQAEDLVPGDMIVLQEGDIIPADGILLDGTELMVDESTLTGESQPVMKDAVEEKSDRQLFAGTTLLVGRGTAEVTVTGVRTRYGRIGVLMSEIRERPTPLQRLIRRLVWQLAAGAIALCLGVFMIEIVRGGGWAVAVIAAVSLGIAAVPEEFPMVYTLYLALGAWGLAREHALIRRLTGVETLGATTVICTDKTGTLTEGRVEVAALYTSAGITRAPDALTPEARSLIEASVLASEPSPFDPLEQALIRFGTWKGIDVASLHNSHLVEDYPFDAKGKYKSHVWRRGNGFLVCAKGAAEGILERTRGPSDVRREALEANRALADEGLRVIAAAAGSLPAPTGNRRSDEQALRFVGLVAFSDPARPGVADALGECGRAGIRVIMITGDHAVTAHAVAEGLDLPHTHEYPIATGDDLDHAGEEELHSLVRRVNIFARTRPEQKDRLVRALRAEGHVVAMTGDGVNDAPALREADIGVAMGQRGTEVARAAATIVLLDDNFATIVSAIREGRRIFENLRRAFSYLIAFHTPLLFAALIVPLLGVPLLLLPLHLVWLELLVHPTASLVFEYDPPPPDLMSRPPRRPGTGLVAGMGFITATVRGLMLSAATLALYLGGLARALPEPTARGTALASLVLGQVVLVLVERSPSVPIWQTSLTRNRVLLGIVGVTVGSLVAFLYVPFLASLLKLGPLSLRQWAVAGAVALGATIWGEPLKAWRSIRRNRARATTG